MKRLFFNSRKYFPIILSILFFLHLNCRDSNENSIYWFTEKEKAFKKAEIENKKIIIFFRKAICKECKNIQKTINQEEKLKKYSRKFIFLTISENEKDFEGFFVDDRFTELKNFDFFFVILNISEEILFKTDNFKIFRDSLENL